MLPKRHIWIQGSSHKHNEIKYFAVIASITDFFLGEFCFRKYLIRFCKSLAPAGLQRKLLHCSVLPFMRHCSISENVSPTAFYIIQKPSNHLLNTNDRREPLKFHRKRVRQSRLNSTICYRTVINLILADFHTLVAHITPFSPLGLGTDDLHRQHSYLPLVPLYDKFVTAWKLGGIATTYTPTLLINLRKANLLDLLSLLPELSVHTGTMEPPATKESESAVLISCNSALS